MFRGVRGRMDGEASESRILSVSLTWARVTRVARSLACFQAGEYKSPDIIREVLNWELDPSLLLSLQ